MGAIEVWKAWYAAFEQSASDDQWLRLGSFLTDDAQYRVSGVPFAGVIKGRDAIVSGFAKSFRGFDRKFDRRTHMVVGSRLHEPNHIEADIWGIYEKAGLPTLAFSAIGHWHVDGDRIGLMVDVYDPARLDSQSAFAWLAAHGEAMGGLDPSYA